MRKEATHRTIKLDSDVANIASELAKQRKLSSVLSELLRREYGITFEEDLIQSQVNELQRQREGIEKALNDLQQIQDEKLIKLKRSNEIENLEKEFSLLKLRMEDEIEEARKQTLDHYNISTDGLEDWEITGLLAKTRGQERMKITQKYNNRKQEILDRLEELKDA